MKRRAVFILGAKWIALVRGWRRDWVVGGMETVSNDAKRTVAPPNAKHSTLLQGCFLCFCLHLRFGNNAEPFFVRGCYWVRDWVRISMRRGRA